MTKTLFFLFLTLSLVGCSKETSQTSEVGTANQPRLKKLLSSTDSLVIKHFFPPSSLNDPIKREFVTAGYCQLGPVIAFEPGKENERLKGIRVEVSSTFVRQNEFSKPDVSSSFLDLDEVKDLDNALSYMAQTEETWKNQRPADDIEVTFTSKDDFTVAMLPQKTGDILFFQSGRIGTASLGLPVDKLQELQSKVRGAIATLEAN